MTCIIFLFYIDDVDLLPLSPLGLQQSLEVFLLNLYLRLTENYKKNKVSVFSFFRISHMYALFSNKVQLSVSGKSTLTKVDIYLF